MILRFIFLLFPNTSIELYEMKAIFPSQTLSFSIQSKQPFHVHHKNILTDLLILRVLMTKEKHLNIWTQLH